MSPEQIQTAKLSVLAAIREQTAKLAYRARVLGASVESVRSAAKFGLDAAARVSSRSKNGERNGERTK
jgi:hypothetical protein